MKSDTVENFSVLFEPVKINLSLSGFIRIRSAQV